MIPSTLLNILHQARYVYINFDLNEFYIWHGESVIKIYNYVGKEIGQSDIINYQENRSYKRHETINIRDIALSIDDIVFTSRT